MRTQQEIGDDWSAAYCVGSLGNLASCEGSDEEARSLLELCIGTLREIGDQSALAGFLGNLGVVETKRGGFPAARRLLREALEIRVQIGDQRGIAISLQNAAGLNAARKRWEQTAKLWGAAEQARQRVGSAIPPVDQTDFQTSVADARSGLGAERFEMLWSEGALMTLEQAIQLAQE